MKYTAWWLLSLYSKLFAFYHTGMLFLSSSFFWYCLNWSSKFTARTIWLLISGLCNKWNKAFLAFELRDGDMFQPQTALKRCSLHEKLTTRWFLYIVFMHRCLNRTQLLLRSDIPYTRRSRIYLVNNVRIVSSYLAIVFDQSNPPLPASSLHCLAFFLSIFEFFSLVYCTLQDAPS